MLYRRTGVRLDWKATPFLAADESIPFVLRYLLSKPAFVFLIAFFAAGVLVSALTGRIWQ